MANNNLVVRRYPRFTLTKKYIDNNGAEDSAKLYWEVRNGFPRLVSISSTNNYIVNKKVNYDVVTIAPLDYTTANILLNEISSIVDSNSEEKRIIECFNTKFENGERKNEKYLQATITIGRDVDGVIYIGMSADGRRKVKYELMLSEWYKYYNEENNPCDDKHILSNKYAAGYVNAVKTLLTDAFTNDGVSTETFKKVENYSTDKIVDNSYDDAF